MTASRPRVSVIVPTHNRVGLLAEAVHSVLAQTFADFEVIIVDDGSTDRTADRVAGIGDPRVQYHYQVNAGPSRARNAGIALARGEFVAFLDDDDSWLPEKLERQMDVLTARPHVDVVYCGFTFVGAEGEELAIDYHRPASRGSLYVDLMFENVITGSASAALLRKSCFTDVGLFDDALLAWEDQDLWRRLALAGKVFLYLDEKLVRIRWHASNIQKDADRMSSAAMRYLAKLEVEVPAEHRPLLRDVTFEVYRNAALTHAGAGRLVSGMRFLMRSARPAPVRFAAFVPSFLRLVAWKMVQAAAHRVGVIRRGVAA